MARDFNGTTDRLDYANVFTPVGNNITIAGWVNLDGLAATKWAWAVHASGDTNYRSFFRLSVSGSNMALNFAQSGTTVLQRTTNDIDTISNIVAAGWVHIAFTWDGSTTAANCKIYYNGVEQTYATTTDGAGFYTAPGSWSLGGAIFSDSYNVDGQMAEWAGWNRQLSAAEIAALAKRYAPSHFPYLLKWYVPLIRGTNDVYGKTATEDGTTVADHLPMIYPYSAQGAHKAPANAFKAAWARNCNVVLGVMP